MTDDDVHSAVVRWLAILLGVTVIKSHQGGAAPALSYVMVNLLATDDVRRHEQEIEYSVLDKDNSAGLKEILASPVIETEWRLSVHAYGVEPTNLLRPLRSAARINQITESLMPALVVHSVSSIRNVPDFINNRWEPRAQADVNVRGLVRDGFVIDTIAESTFEFTRQ